MQAIGEVLSSNITGFTAQAWIDEGEDVFSQAPGRNRGADKLPSFGSFIKSYSEDKQLSIFAVVYNIITAPTDQHHRPTALRMSREELKREQPQIFSLLKTEWHTAIVAYKRPSDRHAVCGLPPFPPEIHDFVYFLSDEELIEVSENLEYLRMLQNVSGVPSDELLAATIRNAASARHEDYKYLVSAGQHITRLFRDDYDRLGSILAKIRP